MFDGRGFKALKGSLCLLLLSVFIACGGSDDSQVNSTSKPDGNDENESTALPEHACGHAQNGPFVPEDGSQLRAAGEASGEHPTIRHGEWSAIKLQERDEGSYGGFISFKARKSGDHRFFTNESWPGETEKTESDPYLLFSSDQLTFKAKHPVGSEPGCVEVNFNHFYSGVKKGETYDFEIVSHPSEVIYVVAVPGGENNHDG